MYYEQDWVLRQIQMAVTFLSRALFGKEEPIYSPREGEDLTPAGILHLELCSLLAGKQYGKGEDLLFDSLDPQDLEYMEVALDYYHRLSQLSPEDLEQHGFSQSEIAQGVKEIAQIFGVQWELADLTGEL